MGSNADLGNVIPRTLLTQCMEPLEDTQEGFVSGYHLENVMGEGKGRISPRI